MIPPKHTIFWGCILAVSIVGNARASQFALAIPKGYEPANEVTNNLGYTISEYIRHREHNDPSDPYSNYGPVILDQTIPLIESPSSYLARTYNVALLRLAAKWWITLGGPPDNLASSDPSTDVWLDCEAVGFQPPVDNYTAKPDDEMLPNVISASCGIYRNVHGGAHGGGIYWGFNWILNQGREIRASDVFRTNSNWQSALTTALYPAGVTLADGMKVPDLSNTAHWVLETKGLGLTYSMNEFSGTEDGGLGAFALVSWSTLKRYLKPGGIVPRKYWNAH
jgi:hypothetical protein